MLKETVQKQGHQRPHQWKQATAQLALLIGLLTHLSACSGGSSSSSSHDPALASTCSPSIASGSPSTNNLNSARTSHTATLLPDGTVLVAGGSGGAGLLTSAELYNPTTGQWTATGDLTVARTSHTATLLPNGTVLVTGGSGNTGLLTSAELYNTTTGLWAATGALTVARTSHTATLLPTPLPNGTVLVAGGHGSTGLLTSAELYNPTTGEWAATGALTVARTSHTATLLPTPLPNGAVLVAGGHGSTGLVTSAELYNPTTGEWAATGDLTVVRASHHTATLLSDGTVLVAGGHGSTGPLTSSEVVTPSNEIQVRLTWDSATDPSVKGYKVYYGAAPKSYEQAIDAGLRTTYSFSNLRGGTTYYFAVTAYSSVAEGCSSSEVSKTTP
ncbi:MAG: fibronectin type III domain-containing protein [Nitrospirae bacterium]|nr:fibronectin type III domain-containing protein [Nitrospirota bacterium]